jgi:hypothetical protein
VAKQSRDFGKAVESYVAKAIAPRDAAAEWKAIARLWQLGATA